MLKILTVIFCLFLSACMVGPNYKEPKKNIAPHWLKNSPGAGVRAAPIRNANWWQAFRDPTLTSLIQQGYFNNLSLQVAGVRVLQARAQLAQAVGELYPQQQNMGGNVTYNRIGGSSLQDILPSNFETAAVGFTASWEIDFWGKYRRAIRSDDATFLSSVAAYDDALVSLTADIASTYVSIRTDEKLIRVTQANIQLQIASLKVAQSRYKGGQTSLLDVEQAQTELAETQATLPTLISELQTQKDKLAVLLGTTPNCVDDLLKKNQGIPKAPSMVSVGIPREALAQRPDVYQARMDAIAQSEAIGATAANLYPAFSLSGTFYFAANTIGNRSLSDIFNWSNRNISAGPSFLWPILNYGQITNQLRMQDAAFQQALLKYLNLVLQAQKEVQDNITRYVESKKSEAYLIKANNAATVTTKLAMTRYKEGETDYTTLLDTERQLLRVQKSLTQSQGDIAQSLVALYRALGGGWQIRCGNDIVRKHIKADMAARTNWGNLLKKQNHLPPLTEEQRIKQLYLPNW